MNYSALLATVAFAGALLSVFGVIYRGAAKSHSKGELGYDGISIMRWALLGQLLIFVILAITTFFT